MCCFLIKIAYICEGGATKQTHTTNFVSFSKSHIREFADKKFAYNEGRLYTVKAELRHAFSMWVYCMLLRFQSNNYVG